MKLKKDDWLRALTRARFCLQGLGLLTAIFAAMLAQTAPAQAPTTTTVSGTVYLANGQPGAGTLAVSWPSFTTAAGQLVVADSITVTIPSDGFVSVNLAPNQGATPAGEYYTAVFYMSDGSTNTEYWLVPAASSASLASVQAQVMPAAQAVQTVSKAYVDEAIAELSSGEITSSGGTLSGPLYLSGDPTQPLQAADKHYVDTEVAADLPLTGGTLSGSITATQIGALYQVDQFAGADFGAKLAACLSGLSATYGGTCDARNFTGSLSMGSNLTIATSNTTILLPCATITTANRVIVSAGTRNVALRGCALRGGSAASGSQGGTVFAYTGTAAAIQVGDPTYTADTPGFHLDNVVINTTGSSSAAAEGFIAYRTQELDLESLYFLGNANQTGMTLDGTGNYTGGTFLDNQLDGFATAVNAIGHQVSNPATTDWVNASSFVRLHIDCPTSGGSPISGTYGINLQQGDGNTFTGGDVENCATALHLGANAQNNTIVGLRNENSTNQVVADTGSSYNNWMTGGTMFTGKLTDNGTRNSFLDTFHRSFNSLNGDWYGSQQDATVTNHYRLGTGAGNERGLLDEYQTDYGYRWTLGLSDATAGEQFYQILDQLNNVYRFEIGQYNNGSPSTNNQTVINAAGTGAVVLNGSNNAGTGGVVIGSGGATESTVATISNAGNAQFNGTLQVGSTSQSAGTMTVRNNADTEVDYYLWPGLTTTQKGSFTYKDWNGNSQWYMLKDASNNWALNSAVGGLDSFKAYQSSNSGDTYVDASNTTGHIRLNYESGSGSETDIYSNGTLDMKISGTTSIELPGLAASSGTNCVQIDNSGFLSNTGSACGSGGGGGGSGTVSSGSMNQMAYYNASGTTVAGAGGVSSDGASGLSVTAKVTAGGLGSFSGISDSSRPVVDTSSLAAGYSGGTDECAKLMQLSYNADQSGYTGSIFRSNIAAAGSTQTCSVAGFWDPFLTTPNSTTHIIPETQGSVIKLAPGATYELSQELDIPTMGTLDGQIVYGYAGTPNVGTWLTYNPSTYTLGTGTFGNVLLSLGCPSNANGSCFSLASVVKNLFLSGQNIPYSTCFFNGSAQQNSYFDHVHAYDCNTGFDFENIGGGGGSQNMDVSYSLQYSGNGTPTTPVMYSYLLTANGSGYTSAPTVTVSGCTTAPSLTAVLTSGSVTSLTYNSQANIYGVNCPSGSTTIGFSGGGGSGASAVPLTEMLPLTTAYEFNRAGSGAGRGVFNNLEGCGGSLALGAPWGADINTGETINKYYCEDGYRAIIMDRLHGGTGTNLINDVTMNSIGECYTAIEMVNKYYPILAQRIDGTGCAFHIVDDTANPESVPNDAYNSGAGVGIYWADTWGAHFSTDAHVVTTLPVGNFALEGTQMYKYVPVKIVSGLVETMTTNDTAEPVGIFLNGYTGSSGYTSQMGSYASNGVAVPCAFPTSASGSLAYGDYVQISATSYDGVGVCADAGSSFPSSGWVIGQIQKDTTSTGLGSLTIPSAPSAPTVTPSTTGSITYSYETVLATYLDRTKSPPSATATTATGPNYLANGGKITLTGVGGTSAQPVDIWRTALGSTMPSCSPVTASGVNFAGMTCTSGAGLNQNFPPSITVSCAGTAPVIDEVIVSAGALLGVHYKNDSFGNCTGTATVTVTRSTQETGWIGQTTSGTFVDEGLPGDGNTPASGGQLAPRVAIQIQKGVAATAGVSSIAANGGTGQTGGINLTGTAVTQPASAQINISSPVGFNAGLVEDTAPSNPTPYLNGKFAAYAAGTSSAASFVGAGSGVPAMAKSTAGGAANEAAGWYNNAGAGNYLASRSPVMAWQFQLPGSGDFASGTSLRIGMGLTSVNGAGGSWTTMIGTDCDASAQQAIIRYSNNAGDAEYQLVTSNGSACNVVAFPSGATPGTSFCVATLTIAYSTSVVGTITCGGTTYTATSSSDLPGATAMAPMFWNVETSTTATHLQIGEVYAYDPGSTI
jgi:hypothetical protein